MYEQAEAEMRAFQTLDTPDLYFQFYANTYPGRRGRRISNVHLLTKDDSQMLYNFSLLVNAMQITILKLNLLIDYNSATTCNLQSLFLAAIHNETFFSCLKSLLRFNGIFFNALVTCRATFIVRQKSGKLRQIVLYVGCLQQGKNLFITICLQYGKN